MAPYGHRHMRQPRRRFPAWGLALAISVCISACDGLLTYSQTERYDNKIVRGVVTYVASNDDMAAIWDASVARLPDAPAKSTFVDGYGRVTVRIERHLGGAYLAYPYVAKSSLVGIGDVVDVPVYVGDKYQGLFSGRPAVARVVCRADDKPCLASREGARRGVIGDVVPRN